MIADDRLRRSRSTAQIIPDIRQLRLALGMTLAEGAALIKEGPSLLSSQEAAGLSADREFVADTTASYLAHALALAARDELPPMLPKDGTAAAIWRFRQGLGVSVAEAAVIVGVTHRALETLEDATRGADLAERQVVWRAYAKWAARRRNRASQRAAEREKSLAPAKVVTAVFADVDAERDRLQFLKLAYTPQLSAAQAEAFVLKYLGVE